MRKIFSILFLSTAVLLVSFTRASATDINVTGVSAPSTVVKGVNFTINGGCSYSGSGPMNLTLGVYISPKFTFTATTVGSIRIISNGSSYTSYGVDLGSFNNGTSKVAKITVKQSVDTAIGSNVELHFWCGPTDIPSGGGGIDISRNITIVAPPTATPTATPKPTQKVTTTPTVSPTSAVTTTVTPSVSSSPMPTATEVNNDVVKTTPEPHAVASNQAGLGIGVGFIVLVIITILILLTLWHKYLSILINRGKKKGNSHQP